MVSALKNLRRYKVTREEFSNIAKGMKAVYSRDKFMVDKDAFDVWYMLLAEYDYKDVSQAVKSYMSTEKFPPVPADIIDKMHKVHEMPSEMSELEAWNKVYKAICNSSYHAQEEFDNLPPLIQRIVGSPNQLSEWGRCDIEEVNTVIQSNFMRSYKAKSSQQKTFNRLPSDVKQQIALETSSLVGIGVKE
jgi:hypothetical protein